MGQPQDRGNETVVRLRGLPFQVSKEEIAQFFTGENNFLTIIKWIDIGASPTFENQTVLSST